MHNRWVGTYRMKQRRPDTFCVDEISDTDLARCAMHSTTAGRSAADEALDAFPDNRIRKALQALPEGFRLVLYYVDVEGYTYAETARLLGNPLGTVMSRISRARERLRLGLAELANATIDPDAVTQRVA